MNRTILALNLRQEPDVVIARQRAVQISELLGFNRRDQIRLGTAVSEVARNAYQFAGQGRVEFSLSDKNEFLIQVSDQGPGIANLKEVIEGRYISPYSVGIGLSGARRLLPLFEIRSDQHGTTVTMGKGLPSGSALDSKFAGNIADKLALETSRSAYEEIQRQNRELIQAAEDLARSRTELKQLNRELEDTNRGVVALYAELDEKAEYLRRASDLKTRFLSNMTHEFRTPVNSILSLCRILLDKLDGDLSSEQEKQVRFIQKAATDLSELVNDLLDLAKVEAGKITVRPEEFEVNALFAALRGTLRPLLSHNTAINLVFDELQNIPVLHTDEVKISQILRNLISNALKFTEKGEVRVSARLAAKNEITFAVSDTGAGIPLEHHERIFDEFVQLEGAHQQKVRGTGLGLPITKRLTELLGGRISVKSEAGVGTTIHVTIPIVYSKRQEAGSLSTTVDPLRFPVLIVADREGTFLQFEKVSKGTPFQWIPFRSIRDARNALLELNPIALIIEVDKQDEKVWGCVNELKMNPASQHTWLCVISDERDRGRALALGVNAFHVRPIEASRISKELDACVAVLPRPVLLLVDDDEAARHILREVFRETRFKIVEASTGADALAIAEQVKPAAIFLDLTMPGMDGIEVTTQLKADVSTREIPIIIHSAKTLDMQEQAFLKANVAAILSKNDTSREGALTGIREALLAAGVIKQ